MFFKKLLLFLLVLTIVISCKQNDADVKDGKDEFRLYALKYGDSTYPGRFIYRGGSGNHKFSWLVYLIQYEDRNILIDTGFSDDENIKKFNVKLTPIPDLLAKLKLKPDQITDLIVTHSHFDHAADISKYKNARLYIQNNELETILADNQQLKKHIDTKKINEELFNFQNFYEISENILVEKIGGHSKGSCSVKIAFEDKVIFLPGDEGYFRSNFLLNSVTGTSVDWQKSYDFTYKIHKLLRVPGVEVYTFHDPKIIDEENGIKLIFQKVLTN